VPSKPLHAGARGNPDAHPTDVAKPKLLFVDDDESIRQTLPRILTAAGFDCVTCASVREAIAEIGRQQFDILLSDLNIGEAGDGFIVVGAMRRVQPRARTYILTGFPNFASALEAIRRQVDDYLVKPADIPTLLKTLRAEPEGSRAFNTPGKRVSTLIRENAEAIIERWAEETEHDQELKQRHLSRESRIDHLPGVLRQLANRLDKNPDINDKQEMESAWEHGRTRRLQGYSIPLILAESRILYSTIAHTVQGNLAEMDISSIIPDLILTSENLNAMLAESLRSFMAGEQIAA
jgi:ActR/RegA family two-component response regulator